MSLADHMAVAIRQNANSVDATYSAFSGASSVTVRGAFFNTPDVILGVEANGPRFDCMLSDVPNPRHDDRITIAGVRYRARSVRQDPVGGTVSFGLELVK